MHIYPPQSMHVEVKLNLISNSIHLNKYGSVCLAPRRSAGASVRTPAPVCPLHVGTHAALCLMLAPCLVPRTMARATPYPTHCTVAHVRFVSHAVLCPAPAPWCPSALTRMQASPAAAAVGCYRWVSLQHVQHDIYFCNI